MNALKRICLLVAYVGVSLAISWLFIDETGLPLALLGSWGWLLISRAEGSPIHLAITYLMYSSVLYFAATAQARRTSFRYPYLSFAGHGIGCFVAFFNQPFIETGSSIWHVASFFVGLPIVTFYILFDWRLAKGGRSASAFNPPTGPKTIS